MDILVGIGIIALIGILAVTGLVVLGFSLVYLTWRTRKIFLPEIVLGLMNVLDYPIRRLFWLFKLDTQAVDIVKTMVINKLYYEDFKETKPSERLLVLPQCLRNINCPAKLDPTEGIKCLRCGLCEIANIMNEAEKLGMNVAIVPGGTFAARMIKKYKPKAVIGVACPMEIREGAEFAIKYNVIPQTVPLLRGGCISTLVDWDEVRRLMYAGTDMEEKYSQEAKVKTEQEKR